jgi:hypothetical protein
MTKALFINSEKKEITEVVLDGDFRTIQRFVGGHFTQHQPYLPTFTGYLLILEDALLKPFKSAFVFKNTEPLLGNALIVGPTKKSAYSDVQFTIEEAKANIKFVDDLNEFNFLMHQFHA